MITTGTIAKALRKNTTCPTGTVSPKPRMSADITPNSSTDMTFSAIPLAMSMRRDAKRGRTAGVMGGRESITPSAAPEGGCVHASSVGGAWRRSVCHAPNSRPDRVISLSAWDHLPAASRNRERRCDRDHEIRQARRGSEMGQLFQSFWWGEPLSPYEWLGLKSFIDF